MDLTRASGFSSYCGSGLRRKRSEKLSCFPLRTRCYYCTVHRCRAVAVAVWVHCAIPFLMVNTESKLLTEKSAAEECICHGSGP